MCSASCGGGKLRRTVRCVEENHNGDVIEEHADESECGNLVKPDLVESCNEFLCPTWRVGDWSDVRYKLFFILCFQIKVFKAALI